MSQPPPPGTPPPTPPPMPSSVPPSEVKNWAMAAHLSALIGLLGLPSFLGPLVVWIMKKDSDAYIAEHAREALNFNISVLIYALGGAILVAVGTVVTLGLGLLVFIPAAIAAVIAWLVVVIVAGMKAANGERYRYPVTIRLVS